MTIIDLLKALGIETASFIAGSSGAIVFLSKTKKMTKTQQFLTVLSGGLSANYLTPLAIKLLGLEQNLVYGVAFILGYSGMKFVETIIMDFTKRFRSDASR